MLMKCHGDSCALGLGQCDVEGSGLTFSAPQHSHSGPGPRRASLLDLDGLTYLVYSEIGLVI